MRHPILSILCYIAIVTGAQRSVTAQTYAEQIVGGFIFPTFGAFAPGETNRMFVGRIWQGQIEIVDLATRSKLPTPFLEINDLPSPLGGGEQGLLGLAFDPDYATNGYFYVDYTGADNSIIVKRFQVVGDPATSNIADPNSGYAILSIPKSENWHNAGWIGFGPNDGYLYVNVGDPDSYRTQNIDNLQGKVLRIDVRNDGFPGDPTRNYSIPPTNPFVDKDGADEVWAYGLRNPCRASFDRETGDLWINDVGQNDREEVNFQPADSPGGENYGWPWREGTIEGGPPLGGPLLPEYVEPIYDYSHNDPDPLFRGSVIGASRLYRGPVDEFYGHYLFTDYGSRNFWELDPDAVDVRASVTNINHLLIPDAGGIDRIAAFSEDAEGNVYMMETHMGGDGDIFLITTASKDMVWNGNNPSAGAAGDVVTWGQANNWTRDGVADIGFVADDSVIFAAGSSQAVVDLGEDRTVASVIFQAPYQLQNHTLRVMSGNVVVEAGITAVIDSELSVETVNHSIRKLGPGTLLVNGHAGQTAVKEGTLGGSGTFDHLTVRDGATLAPGAPIGILTVNESFTMHDGATLLIELNGTDNSNPLSAQYDQLVVGAAMKLAGNLDVKLFNDGGNVFAPQDGDSFNILSAAEMSGSFNEVHLPELTAGLVWEIDPADGNALFIHATSDFRSDYNGNGTVDAADYVLWRELAGQFGGALAADGTGPNGAPDGLVNEWDYNLWRANFGKTITGATGDGSTNVPVPEPSEATLLAVLVLSLWISSHRAMRKA